LGFGVWVLGFGPNPQTPNPQSPIPNPQNLKISFLIKEFKFSYIYSLKKDNKLK